jgi:hypothetical protein
MVCGITTTKITTRPVTVTIVACVYILMGVVGFAYHFTEMRQGLGGDAVWVELLRLLAIVCGVFMLRGANWARWVALAWMALHVVISIFHSLPELALHCLFFTLIAWVLFRPDARRYFR